MIQGPRHDPGPLGLHLVSRTEVPEVSVGGEIV